MQSRNGWMTDEAIIPRDLELKCQELKLICINTELIIITTLINNDYDD